MKHYCAFKYFLSQHHIYSSDRPRQRLRSTSDDTAPTGVPVGGGGLSSNTNWPSAGTGGIEERRRGWNTAAKVGTSLSAVDGANMPEWMSDEEKQAASGSFDENGQFTHRVDLQVCLFFKD